LLIGTDIEQISRIQLMMESTPQFVETCFTAEECSYCNCYAQSAPHYAARFCAKEAFCKAMNQHVNWLDIEIINESSGKPVIRLHRNAQSLTAGHSIAITLSHSGDYAMATVILWSDGERQAPPTS
jgi:holo-[acyl-carrier protein] synthase